MGWREQQSARQFRAEQEAAERAERERIEKPIREAEATLKKNHAALIAIQRENVEKGLRDDEDAFYLSPAMQTVRMPTENVARFNKQQAEQFAESPEYQDYRSDANGERIVRYLESNGVQIADAETFRGAFIRLRDLGLLQEIEQPVIEPAIVEQPEPEPADAAPDPNQGWDIETGTPRLFTDKEISDMDSLTYRKCFRIYKDQLMLNGRRRP